MWPPRWIRVWFQRPRRPLPTTSRPVLEALEDRCTPATFVVTTTGDSGPGSLRAALLQANATPGADRIAFALPTGDPGFVDVNNNRGFDDGDYWSITPNTALPSVGEKVTLDGWSQGGPSYSGRPLVELDGRNAGPRTDGLVFADHTGSTVRGLVVSRFHGNGVVLSGGGGHQLVGNFIGTDAAGQSARGNELAGVLVDSSKGNRIGGAGAGQGNLISGNDFQGLRVVGAASTDNRVVANRIGTNRAGDAALANGSKVEDGDGIRIEGGRDNVIGGRTAAERNLLAGNYDDGIDVRDGASGNVIRGNWIGVDATGRNPLGNGADGIYLQDASHNVIGGLNAGEGNVSGANGFNGIFLLGDSHDNLIANNFIGTNAQLDSGLGNSTKVKFADGIFLAQFDQPRGPTDNTIFRNTIAFNRDSAIAMDVSTAADFGGNRIQENSIFGNGGVAIDLASNGVTPNDPLDADGGPNGLQNYPVLSGLVPLADGRLSVTGTLDSTPNRTFRIEFFASPALGEGAVFLGYALVMTDSSGHATLTFAFESVAGMPYVTATATDLTTGDTSEFSAPIL